MLSRCSVIDSSPLLWLLVLCVCVMMCLFRVTGACRLTPQHTVEGSNAAHAHPPGPATQGPYLPVPWQHAAPQGQGPAQPRTTAAGTKSHDPYYVGDAVAKESLRSDLHRYGAAKSTPASAYNTH
jgi:hypothetical protein